jgi:hypothetical protein
MRYAAPVTTIVITIIVASGAYATEELEQLSKFRGHEDALTYAFFMLKAGSPFNEEEMLRSVEITSTVHTTFDYATPTKKERARYKQIIRRNSIGQWSKS